jgi:antitoxin (DNA-binding transcriptional repressor) of toxin-antitoxin stability system
MLVANHGAPIARILQKERNKRDGRERKEVTSSSEAARQLTNIRALEFYYQ